MIAQLKILRIAPEDEEHTLLIRNLNNENEPPYLFQVGDNIEIDEDGTIHTYRRGANHKYPQVVPSIEWLERQLKELHWKIQHSLENDSFTSQADVYERNYLLEIYNTVMKRANES